MLRFAFWLSGALLIGASLAKAIALSGVSISPRHISSDWWLTITSISLELFIGGWLLLGVWPRMVRGIAISCFSLFSAVLIWKIYQGESSCGCFGNWEVPPEYMLPVDLLLVVLLMIGKPPDLEPLSWRTPVLFLVSLLFLCGTLSLWIYAKSTEVTRSIHIASAFHEFGEVGQNVELTHEFPLENRSAFDVEIMSSQSTCTCTTTQVLEGTIIPAGATVHVPVSLHTGTSDEHIAGRISLFCRRVGSTNSAVKLQELLVAAKVQPDFWVRPTLVDFGQVHGDATVKRTIRLRPHRQPDVTIQSIRSSHPAFQTRVLPARTTEGDWQIEVHFSGKSLNHTGRVESLLTIETSSRNRPKCLVLARAFFRSPITLSPEMVVVGSDVDGDVEREILLSGVPSQRVCNISLSDERATVRKESRHSDTVLRIFLPAQLRASGLSARLRFRVDPEFSEPTNEARWLEVPIDRLPGKE